jgi:hypothetical protein
MNLALACICALVPAPKAPEWHTETSKELRFQLQFPGKPKQLTQDSFINGMSFHVWEYAPADKKATFLLIYSSLPVDKADKVDPGKMLESIKPMLETVSFLASPPAPGNPFARRMEKRVPPKVIKQENDKVGEYPGLRVTTEETKEGASHILRHRIILTAEGVYWQIVHSAKEKEVDNEDVQRFFESLKLDVKEK